MNRFRASAAIKPTIGFGVVALIAATLVFNTIATSQESREGRQAADVEREEIALAELQLSLLIQQIVVATAEMEMLEPTQLAAEQQIAIAEANLEAATMESETAARLSEKNVISKSESRLKDSKRKAMEAQLVIARAQSELAAKSANVRKEKLKLLQMQAEFDRQKLTKMKRDLGIDQ